MRPLKFILDLPDRCLANFKKSSYRGLTFAFAQSFSNFKYILRSKSSFGIVLTNVFSTSISVNHVPHVIKLGSYEEMVRIKTGRVITLMKNGFFTSNGRIEKKIRTYTVRFIELSFYSKDSIALFMSTFSPLPATIFGYFSIIKQFFLNEFLILKGYGYYHITNLPHRGLKRKDVEV